MNGATICKSFAKAKGEIAMTESELVGFFGVTWRKLNYRLQLLLKVSPLQPDERDTGEQEVYVNGRLRGYALLYPLTIIIALSYQLDSMEPTCSGNTFVENYNAQNL